MAELENLHRIVHVKVARQWQVDCSVIEKPVIGDRFTGKKREHIVRRNLQDVLTDAYGITYVDPRGCLAFQYIQQDVFVRLHMGI